MIVMQQSECFFIFGFALRERSPIIPIWSAGWLSAEQGNDGGRGEKVREGEELCFN